MKLLSQTWDAKLSNYHLMDRSSFRRWRHVAALLHLIVPVLAWPLERGRCPGPPRALGGRRGSQKKEKIHGSVCYPVSPFRTVPISREHFCGMGLVSCVSAVDSCGGGAWPPFCNWTSDTKSAAMVLSPGLEPSSPCSRICSNRPSCCSYKKGH